MEIKVWEWKGKEWRDNKKKGMKKGREGERKE